MNLTKTTKLSYYVTCNTLNFKGLPEDELHWTGESWQDTNYSYEVYDSQEAAEKGYRDPDPHDFCGRGLVLQIIRITDYLDGDGDGDVIDSEETVVFEEFFEKKDT